MRLHPNTGSVDPRQPFLRRIVRLVEPEEEMPKGEGGEKEEGDWYVRCVGVFGRWVCSIMTHTHTHTLHTGGRRS